MSTVELTDIQEAAKWIAATKAKDAQDACAELGISRPRLSQMMTDGDILGRKFDGRVWIPQAEIDRHKIKPGETRVGRPRSGSPKARKK